MSRNIITLALLALASGAMPAQPARHARPAPNPAAIRWANLRRLERDLGAFRAGSPVTQTQRDRLELDLIRLSGNPVKTNPALVKRLVEDLSAALADGTVAARERTQLAQDLRQVLDRAHLTDYDVNEAITDAQAILAASGISPEKVQAVFEELKALAPDAVKHEESTASQE